MIFRRLIAAVAAVVALTIAAFCLPSTAAADPSVGQLQINLGAGWTSHASGALFNVREIDPGWKDTATLGVRNESAASGPLTLTATNVTDECRSGATCAAGERRLGQDLRLAIFLDRGAQHAVHSHPAWTGRLSGLRSPLTLASAMTSGTAWRLRIAVELPTSTGNADQGAQLSFDVALRLQGQAAQVLGLRTARAGSTDGGGLALTGVSLLLTIGGGVLLAVSGAFLAIGFRERRGRTSGQ